jgi:hypothetical protein
LRVQAPLRFIDTSRMCGLSVSKWFQPPMTLARRAIARRYPYARPVPPRHSAATQCKVEARPLIARNPLRLAEALGWTTDKAEAGRRPGTSFMPRVCGPSRLIASPARAGDVIGAEV